MFDDYSDETTRVMKLYAEMMNGEKGRRWRVGVHEWRLVEERRIKYKIEERGAIIASPGKEDTKEWWWEGAQVMCWMRL